MNTIFKTIIATTFATLTVIVGIFFFTFLSYQKVQRENEARFQCALSARYEFRTSTTTISYPPEDLYKKCLKEKGIKTVIR